MASPQYVTVEELLKRAHQGDNQSLGQLLELYRSYLGLLARLQMKPINRAMRSKFSSSDLVQETFLHAHAAFPKFRGQTEDELLAWLRRILANQLATFGRRYGTRQRDIDLEEHFGDELDRSSQALSQQIPADQSTPSEAAVQHEQAVALANALDRLSLDHREVILLRNIESLTFPEVAARMERTLDSVKSLWARAFCKLREALNHE
jgi:RNA polymerase sigma-70 factor (ECF subfamily)